MKNYTLILLLFIATAVFGQKDLPTQGELDGTIESQFDYVITKSNQFKAFKLIRETSILKIKKNTLDSLKTVRASLNAANASLAKNRSKIKDLETEIAALNGDIEKISQEKDSMAFFGASLSKSSYTKIVWSIIILLLLVLLFFIFQFKNSKVVTNQSKANLLKMEEDFEEFRKKALKREQEVMRKLQDELNKGNY